LNPAADGIVVSGAGACDLLLAKVRGTTICGIYPFC